MHASAMFTHFGGTLILRKACQCLCYSNSVLHANRATGPYHRERGEHGHLQPQPGL